MTTYKVIARKKDQRGQFAIYPKDSFNELARVTARTASEAVRVAAVRGFGPVESIWAIEILPENRVILTEEKESKQ